MKDYFKIGEISKIYGIGRDSLRYYEKIGILNPDRDTNGYRMYSMQDIWKLNIVKDLRSLDFPMHIIKEYLDNRNLCSTKGLLTEEIKILDNKIKELNNLKNNIYQRLKRIEITIKSNNFYNIEVLFFKERRAFELNGDISRDEEVDFLIKKLQKKHKDKFYLLGNNSIGARVSMKKINEGFFNYFESVFVLLENDTIDYDMVLEEGDYVTLSYKGTYEQSQEYIPKMMEFIEKNNYEIIGSPIEIYKIDVHETSDVEEFITEIQIPVVKY